MPHSAIQTQLVQHSQLSTLVPEFLVYAQVELGFAEQSLVKYRDCLRQVHRALGDRQISTLQVGDLFTLKQVMQNRGNGISRQNSILLAFKRFLAYCRDVKALTVLDPQTIKPHRLPRREVLFLNAVELERFVGVIKLVNFDGTVYQAGLRFRALVEVLLGSAMRIGEALSLNRTQIDFSEREARIIGKGGKQRVAFFTERSLYWVRRYLDTRTDDCPALFVCQDGRSRWQRTDIWRFFKHYQKLSGLVKPVRPHLLRHSAATQLLFNGCPIGHIKEILGHERLETTCRYYLGLDRRAAKQAHAKFLCFPSTGT